MDGPRTPGELEHFVQRTTDESEVPYHVEDEQALHEVARLIKLSI